MSNKDKYKSSAYDKLKQLSPTAFGGVLNQGKRKLQRPTIDKIPLHVVLKAVDSETLLKHSAEIEDYTRKLSSKFGVTILELAVQPDHVHILPEVPATETYNKWIRALTGNLSRKHQIKWRLPPFTSGVDSPEYLQTLKAYIQKNRRESEFIISAHQRVQDFITANCSG